MLRKEAKKQIRASPSRGRLAQATNDLLLHLVTIPYSFLNIGGQSTQVARAADLHMQNHT